MEERAIRFDSVVVVAVICYSTRDGTISMRYRSDTSRTQSFDARSVEAMLPAKSMPRTLLDGWRRRRREEADLKMMIDGASASHQYLPIAIERANK